jgi:hypothetical protein
MEQRAEQTEAIKEGNTESSVKTNKVSRDEIKSLIEVQTTLLKELISDRKRKEEEDKKKEEERKKASYRNLMPDFCKWADLQKFNPNNVKQYKLKVINDGDEITFLPKNVNNPNEPVGFKIVATINDNVMTVDLIKKCSEKKERFSDEDVDMKVLFSRERVETVFLEKSDIPELKAREVISVVNRLYGQRDNFVLIV